MATFRGSFMSTQRPCQMEPATSHPFRSEQSQKATHFTNSVVRFCLPQDGVAVYVEVGRDLLLRQGQGFVSPRHILQLFVVQICKQIRLISIWASLNTKMASQLSKQSWHCWMSKGKYFSFISQRKSSRRREEKKTLPSEASCRDWLSARTPGLETLVASTQ